MMTMRDILVELYVPAVEETYDVFIPLQASIYKATLLLEQAVRGLTDGRFLAKDALLCSRKNGDILQRNASAEELGLRNGDQLMLI